VQIDYLIITDNNTIHSFRQSDYYPVQHNDESVRYLHSILRARLGRYILFDFIQTY